MTFCYINKPFMEASMINKVPILNNRIRLIPKSFGWIDHRLVRDRHIEKISHPGAALYLFLVCVADARGLSYYGDTALMERISMTRDTFFHAREELMDLGLIAWERPLYQVLSLVPASPEHDRMPGTMMRLGDILNKAAEGRS